MFKLNSKLTMACSAAVLALAMAACSSSSDDSPPVASSTPPPVVDPAPPAPPAPTPVEVADLMYLDEDNMPMAGTAMIAAGEMATNNGVIFMCPAGGDDCEVTVNAEGSVTSTGGAATATLSEDAMVQVAQAKQDKADEDAADTLMHRDQIIGKDRALETASNLPDGAATGGIVGENDITISRAADAMARVRVTGYTAHADAALPNGDWAGTRLMQPVTGTGTNHLFVYTDIEEPTRIQFYNFDDDPMTPARYGLVDTLDDAPLPLGGVDGETFSAGTADLTRFPEPQSAEEGSLTQNYPVNDASTTGEANNRVSIPGNYNGAGGRYLCTPADSGTRCSVTVAPSGAYTTDDMWTFVPELNARAWQMDEEFMSFGWWLQEPTAETGAYTFRYYADGDAYQLPPDTDLAAESATYNGRAAGKFVVQEIDNTGVTGGEAGMFTAAASLTARFNGTLDGGTLEGTISGFQSDNADANVSGWSVTLNRQALSGGAEINLTSAMATSPARLPTAANFDGATAMMGDQTAHGTWSSQFFGQPATDDAYPLGVGGVFQADNEAASIAGAFGARR